MNRTAVLAILAGVLLVAVSALVLFRPLNAELDEIRADTAAYEAQEEELANQVAHLRQVRESAPEQESQLAAAAAVIPTDSGLPALLRQMQASADEAGITLVAISPARPEQVTPEGGATGLASINVTVDIRGNYFQMVDFLRRLEDPSISPRAVNWNALNLDAEPDDYPVLEGSLQGDAFAILPTGMSEVPQDAEDGADVGADTEEDGVQDEDGTVDAPSDDVGTEPATEAEVAASTEVDQ